jgi:uncharacterized protein
MKFTWDEDKRQSNLKKHGVDFCDVPKMFAGPMLVRLDRRGDYGEDRWIGYGFIETMLLAIVYTELHPDIVRVISLRKATRNEEAHFQKAIRD